MDDPLRFGSFTNLIEDLARGHVPQEVARAYMLARMTALRKSAGGARGIATGTCIRRLCARTLARQFGQEMEHACAPFQFALSTQAGTGSVGHLIRLLTDLDPEATVLSIDDIGAYDHVLRSAMLGKLWSLPQARKLLPFLKFQGFAHAPTLFCVISKRYRKGVVWS